jgi:hypothetical protein
VISHLWSVSYRNSGFLQRRFWITSVWPTNRELAGLVGDALIGNVTFYVVKSVRSAQSSRSQAA